MVIILFRTNSLILIGIATPVVEMSRVNLQPRKLKLGRLSLSGERPRLEKLTWNRVSGEL